jgi:riboflavin kinase/FMN adenylyltransferase
MTPAFKLSLHIGIDGAHAVDRAPAHYAIPDGLCAAIGSFDGVHRGHQQVIEAAATRAKAQGLSSAVICFDPHPQALFNPDATPFRLMRLGQQYTVFKQMGVDHVIVLRFDRAMAALSPEAFAQILLQQTLKLTSISCGFDFNFGSRGAGKAEDLHQFGQSLGFGVEIIPCQSDETGQKLSSSAVREALVNGDVARATAILGRPQTYEAEIIRGDQKGRTIGFATLNMQLGPYQHPKYGVYVTQTRLADGRIFKSVSNFGNRPTVDGVHERLETHLFDFDEDIYGQSAEISLCAFIRPEQKFESFVQLKAQIARDAAFAQGYIPA